VDEILMGVSVVLLVWSGRNGVLLFFVCCSCGKS